MKTLEVFANASPTGTVVIPDNTSTVGGGLTGLTFASAGLRISVRADNEATPTVYTAAGSTIETITTLGVYSTPTATKCRFREYDATNHPGQCDLQFDPSRWAVSGAKRLYITVQVTGGVKSDTEIQLTGPDISAAAGGTKAFLQFGAGTGQISPTAGNLTLATTQAFNNTGQTTKQAATLNTTDVTGNLPANAIQIGGQTANAAAAMTFLASVGTATTNTVQTGDAFGRIGVGGASLTALGDTRLANLDAAVSTRSTYAGTDTAGTTTLLTRITVSPPTAPQIAAAVGNDSTDGIGAGVALLISRITAPVALASQIPVNFTSACFVSAGVFSTTALANAPTGGSAPSVIAIRAEMDTNSTQLAAIIAKTSTIPASPATMTGLALSTAEHTAIAADATGALTAQGYTSARAIFLDNLSLGFVSGTVQTGPTTTTIVLPSSFLTTDNIYKDKAIVFTTGLYAGLAFHISGYVGATKTATLSQALPSAPAVGDKFAILGQLA